MNIGVVDSELNFNYRLFCKTVSKSANWGFDRFRLYSPAWHTKVQVRRPDGSIVATQDFSGGGFEHTFSFDLSENVNNDEYSVYVAGVAAGASFVQVYAYPTGYGGTYGKNAELTFWDFSQVNLVDDGANGIGRIRLENNPVTTLAGLENIAAGEINFTNCQLDAETLADALIYIDNSGVLNGSFKYSGNLAAPAERALTAYNNLKDTKGWTLTGDVPADSPYEPETIAFMEDPDVAIPNDSTIYYSGTLQETTGAGLWTAIDNFVKREKTSGRWSKYKFIRPRIGGTALAHGVNLKDVSKYRGIHYGSWTHGPLGSIGNGSNTYLDAEFNPVTAGLTEENAGFSFSWKSTDDSNYKAVMGNYFGNTERFSFYTSNGGASGGMPPCLFDYSQNKKYAHTFKGTLSVNRTGIAPNGIIEAVINGATQTQLTGIAGVMPNQKIGEGANYWGEVSNPYSNFFKGNIGLTSVHEAFTVTEMQGAEGSISQLEADIKRANNW